MKDSFLPPATQLLEAQPSRLLAQVAAYISRVVSQHLEARHAHRYHVSVLSTLAQAGACSQAELSRKTAIDRSDMVATLTTLEARGEVERTVDERDKRRNVVSITPAGTSRLAELAAALELAQAEAFAALSPDEMAQFLGLLGKLRAGALDASGR